MICDCFAIYFSLGKHELSKLLEYEDKRIQIYTTAAIIIIFILDSVATILSVLNIILLLCLQTEQYREHLHTILRIFCYIITCEAKRGHYMYKPVTSVADTQDNENPLDEYRDEISYLQKSENWLIWKREEKRQSQLEKSPSWLQQWKNELDLQEDLLLHWENYVNLQKHRLRDEYNEDKLKQNIQEWKNKLNKWSNSLLSVSEAITASDKEWQQQLKEKQKSLKKRQNELQTEKHNLKKKLQVADLEQHKGLNERILAENKAWFLMFSLLAPLICIGTHGGFVVMAWASDPGEASSIAFIFTPITSSDSDNCI